MVVLGVANLDQRGLEVDVAGERVAADLDAVACGAFDVEAAADLQRAQRRERQALLHHVEVGAVAVMVPDDGQAGAVAGDAGADLLAGEKAGRELQREAAQTGAVGEGRHGGDGLDDAGEHDGMRSLETNDGAEPISLGTVAGPTGSSQSGGTAQFDSLIMRPLACWIGRAFIG